MKFNLLLMAAIARGGFFRTWALLTVTVFILMIYALTR